jgi:hypothetical protein
MGRWTWSALLALLALAVMVPAAGAATTSGTIDFETVSAPQSPTGEGLVVDNVASGSGISGDTFAGSVGVFGFSPDPALAGRNTAVIFDATCTVDEANGVPEDCSGADADLFLPQLGNVLIIAENMRDNNANDRIDSPDDSDLEGVNFDFDFGDFGDGTLNIKSLDVADVDDDETDGRIEAYRGGVLVKTVPVPLNGNNVVTTLAIDANNVDQMKVFLDGSAAIDNIRFEIVKEDPPEECPKWKKHWGLCDPHDDCPKWKRFLRKCGHHGHDCKDRKHGKYDRYGKYGKHDRCDDDRDCDDKHHKYDKYGKYGKNGKSGKHDDCDDRDRKHKKKYGGHDWRH